MLHFHSGKIINQKLCYLNKYGVYKLSLIDLEIPKRDDRAQASLNAVQGDRLSGKAS